MLLPHVTSGHTHEDLHTHMHVHRKNECVSWPGVSTAVNTPSLRAQAQMSTAPKDASMVGAYGTASVHGLRGRVCQGFWRMLQLHPGLFSFLI